MIHVPAGVLKLLYNPLVNWNYATEPEPGIGDRADPLAARPRARRLELDQRHALCPRQPGRLRRLGADGLQRLDRSTRCCPTSSRSSATRRATRSSAARAGPMLVEDYRTILPLTHRFVEAAQQAGIALHPGPQRQPAGRRRLFADVAQWPLPRLDRAHLPGRRRRAGPTCASRPRRSPPGCCSRASAASVSPSARAASDRQVTRRARGDPVGRHHQLAAPAAGLRHRPGRAPAVDRRRRRARSARASAPTCPTTTSSASRIGSRTRCRSTSCRAGCGSAARSPAG